MSSRLNPSLSFYLSEAGIQKTFREWYSSIPIFTPVEKQISDLAELLQIAYKCFNRDIILTIQKSITCILELQFQIYYKSTPMEIFDKWISDISPYCFQGGYGHSIIYTNAPHHWCIKPEYYTQIIEQLPCEVIIASVILNRYLEIAILPEMEKWSS
jgi:hypothetical protein